MLKKTNQIIQTTKQPTSQITEWSSSQMPHTAGYSFLYTYIGYKLL